MLKLRLNAQVAVLVSGPFALYMRTFLYDEGPGRLSTKQWIGGVVLRKRGVDGVSREIVRIDRLDGAAYATRSAAACLAQAGAHVFGTAAANHRGGNSSRRGGGVTGRPFPLIDTLDISVSGTRLAAATGPRPRVVDRREGEGGAAARALGLRGEEEQGEVAVTVRKLQRGELHLSARLRRRGGSVDPRLGCLHAEVATLNVRGRFKLTVWPSANRLFSTKDKGTWYNATRALEQAHLSTRLRQLAGASEYSGLWCVSSIYRLCYVVPFWFRCGIRTSNAAVRR